MKPSFEPKDNRDYAKQEYWEARFREEEEYEWLVDYSKCRTQLLEVTGTPGSQRILLIGCGNSNLGFDMWKDGFCNVDCIDYAQSVIERIIHSPRWSRQAPALPVPR